MSEDASYELQRAIYAALTADAGVSALVAGRIYDRVPADVVFPYVSFGPEQELPERPDCLDLTELEIQIDAWSQDPGHREVKRLAAAIVAALDVDGLSLGEHALAGFHLIRRRILTDPDGLTAHAVLIFRAAIEKH